MEVSAKDGQNIQEAFQNLGELINQYVKAHSTEKDTEKDKRISLHDKNAQVSNEGGCKC